METLNNKAMENNEELEKVSGGQHMGYDECQQSAIEKAQGKYKEYNIGDTVEVIYLDIFHQFTHPATIVDKKRKKLNYEYNVRYSNGDTKWVDVWEIQDSAIK